MKLRVKKIITWPLCLLLFIGFTFLGNSDILCIGENGQMEFETECNPCCDATSEICIIETNDDFNGEHSECGDCSDLILDGPLLSKRVKEISLINSTYIIATTFNNSIFSISDNIASPLYTTLLTFDKFPQSASIAYSSVLC